MYGGTLSPPHCGHCMQLLERGRQAARHVRNARHSVQQVESLADKEQREKLKPSALTALEGRERELKACFQTCAHHNLMAWHCSWMPQPDGRLYGSQILM